METFMKRKIMLILFLCVSTYTCPVPLTSSQGLIKRFIDGFSFGIDGNMFALMLKIRRDLKQIMFGNKESVGHYSYGNKIHTLEQLIPLAKRNSKKSKEFNYILHTVKQDLDIHLTQYAQLAKGVKKYMLIFINESCQKHGRKSSILQNWAKVREGYESAQLQRDLTDLATCLQFCTDLVNFLEDMCDSCPKAQEQFKTLLRQK